jgi:hypothetical protein
MERRHAQQSRDLNPQLPEFQPRNALEGQRAEQVAMPTGSTGENDPKPGKLLEPLNCLREFELFSNLDTSTSK